MNRVVPGSAICTDGEKSYNPFAKKNDLVLIQLKHDESEKTAGKKRKAVLKGIYEFLQGKLPREERDHAELCCFAAHDGQGA